MRPSSAARVLPRQSSILPPPRKAIKENDLWEKEETKKQQSTQPLQTEVVAEKPAMTENHSTRVIAYIAQPPKCIYSQELITLARDLHVPLQIFDIGIVEPPEWLPGVPTLETENGHVYCGDAAFNWILAQSAAQQKHQPQPQVHHQVQTITASQPQAQQLQHKGRHHPEIIPRTLPTAAEIVQEARNEPFDFLAPLGSGSEAPKPTAGGATLADARRETERMESLLNAPQETSKSLSIDAIMAARAR